MIYALIYTDSYIKRASKFVKQHPDLISQYQKTLKLLEIDPNHPSLRVHPLKGKLKNLYSISINLSYRITLEFFMTEKEIILVNVGYHKDVY
ncbi:MAG: type II toxin-antitoxin system RelE/ParE family toxin [Proteobacteria bacterium]|nr:type II toxin-antitoxin system RelE/ParE family toxin [Pseudomonadota bacterium]MBU1387014.1 type II toxin-antitoxin system RelE/ParE family toxin [Pseudomonadota bacterium]MBU1542305.1 type II toxin-antitoxin system RelE/ParE family toxin [Pseudomonadota bacterium]MBU2479602.1 type II toxin-antitoxin system RelE/ParE family toxin [Pseudomonadota bacterium]